MTEEFVHELASTFRGGKRGNEAQVLECSFLLPHIVLRYLPIIAVSLSYEKGKEKSQIGILKCSVVLPRKCDPTG